MDRKTQSVGRGAHSAAGYSVGPEDATGFVEGVAVKRREWGSKLKGETISAGRRRKH